MTLFQKIKNALIGVLLLAAAVSLVLVPEESFVAIPVILGITLLVYGFRQLWFYFRMAKHMVGGKSILFRGIIILDVALFTVTISTMNSRIVILIYLLGIYAITGAIDVLRAVEAKQNGDSGWKFKLSRGIIGLAFTVALFIIGFILNQTNLFVYGYCISLTYSGVTRIIDAFRKTAIIYIS